LCQTTLNELCLSFFFSPISLTPPDDQTKNEGDTVSLSITASESGATLKYAADGLAPGLSISPSTGTISGTLGAGAADNGPYSVTVIVEDGTNATQTTFNWNVNSAVSITAPDTQTFNEGDSVSLSIRNQRGQGTFLLMLGRCRDRMPPMP
jgi:hypothetical protein